jgi:hypothetical protein
MALEVNKEVSINVQVLDEGSPLTSVSIGIGFEQRLGMDPMDVQKVLSDTNGMASVIGKSSGRVTITGRKKGFYDHFEDLDLFSLMHKGSVSTNRTVELKRIKNPVPMYVKAHSKRFPVTEEWLGFDFEKGDWVSPHGSGVNKDILFKSVIDFEDKLNHETILLIAFDGEHDGIQVMDVEYPGNQGSFLRSDHLAPEFGYLKELVHIRKSEGHKLTKDYESIDGYYFRVNTVVDSDGNVVSANYGKIYGNFKFDRFNCLIFTYYYNPDKTRNVEFAPEQNLFLKKDGYYLPSYKGGSKYGIGRP